MMAQVKEWQPLLAMVAINFAFAVVNVLLKKVLDEGINHLVLIAYRQAISTLFLAPLAYFLERKDRPKITFRIAFSLFFSAIVGASLTQYFFLFGIENTSATFSCAFINMVPVMTFIMALPFGMEKLNLKKCSGQAKVVGALVCVSGAMVLSLYRGPTLFNHSYSGPAAQSHHATNTLDYSTTNKRSTERWILSSMALLVGAILWSSWFLIQSSIGKIYPCQYSSTAIMAFFGTIQSGTMAFVSTGSNISLWALKGSIQIGTVFFCGIVGSGMCYVGMSWCVKKRGPVFTAAFSPLVQIMAAIIGIPLLHEKLHFGSLLGSVMVIAGLYTLLWGKNRESKNMAQKIAQDQATDQIKRLDEPNSRV